MIIYDNALISMWWCVVLVPTSNNNETVTEMQI